MPVCRQNRITAHVPSGEWGDDTFVQWGEHGLVINTSDPSQSYGTAFFEAFPKTGAGFIRGEGSTVAEAEADALAQRRKELVCENHLWCRGDHLSGLATCSRCGTTDHRALRPVLRLGDWRKPAKVHDLKRLLEPSFVMLQLALAQQGAADPRVERRRVLRLRRLGIDLPERGEEDLRTHAEACAEAARSWARGLDDAGVARLRSPAVLASSASLLGQKHMRDELMELIGRLRAAEAAPEAAC